MMRVISHPLASNAIITIYTLDDIGTYKGFLLQ